MADTGARAARTNHVEGKVIVITGAGGGFGRSLATMTAGLGARIVASDVDDVGSWAITADDLLRQIVYAIDQPWGVTIADITVRATGEDDVH